jgi:SAM-dependent methyltransferase
LSRQIGDPEGVDPAAFNAFEAEGWEQRAGGYHRFFGPITGQVIEPLLDAAAVAGGARVLDLCSGPGYVAAAARERGATVTGIDISSAMVELAGELSPGIHFVQGDAERLPFADDSFDAVVANFAILHLGEPERAAMEVARVLAPGGKAALSVWDAPGRCRLLGLLTEAVAAAGGTVPAATPAGPDFFRFSDPAELERLLADTGLTGTGTTSLRFTHELADPEELWRGILGGTVRMRSLIVGQDEATQARIRSELEGAMREHAVGGGYRVPVSVRIGSGSQPRTASRTSRICSP